MEKTLINKLNQLDKPEWVAWLAQDSNGYWWGYEAEPHQHDSGWYENEIGRCVKLLLSKPDKKWHFNIIQLKK